ncbi:MAG: tRNA glutamyl-Q(34) synthetase GluQRS [Rhodobacteraceae bacterium]|nr:tRNA glutamyl-Q(34) synthetase GluQRS [Alphaproteobacteria bacterium]MBL4766501.1 tRNA glutamyl-Q(34) synthetase GluQRS [Paracoccaceae bacterium]
MTTENTLLSHSALSTTAPLTVTRFAPSPTGLLHLGHAYSALFAEAAATDKGGRFLLRLEDIDVGRCRPEFEAAIFEDLQWLGLHWETPVRRQSDHLDDHAAALAHLDDAGLLYPCFCTRKDLAREAAMSLSAPHSPDGPIYPGTCRNLDKTTREERITSGAPHALRLDTAKAMRTIGRPLTFTDSARGRIDVQPEDCGDVVLARKDIATSYHLAVVVDDARQGVTLITRGEDLLHATPVHRILQTLLGYSEPLYHHHALLHGPDGARYAKRDGAVTLAALRDKGATPEDIRQMIQDHA